MAHTKRPKSAKKTPQKHAQAKQAVKKNHKGAAKHRNEELRTLLDSQAATLLSINKPQNPILVQAQDSPIDLHESVQHLTATMGNL